MAYASISGRARTSARSPSAHAICQRCGFRYNRVDLAAQIDWRGPVLMNTQVYVCRRCTDRPQEQLRAIVLPADPVPVYKPFPEYFESYETNTLYTTGENTVDAVTGLPIIGGNVLVTQGNNPLVAQSTGEPPGGLNQTPGVNQIAVPDDIGGDDPGLPYGFDEVPETGPLNGQ
jgi:hypothetical protein